MGESKLSFWRGLWRGELSFLCIGEVVSIKLGVVVKASGLGVLDNCLLKGLWGFISGSSMLFELDRGVFSAFGLYFGLDRFFGRIVVM